jgi:hypothetical protein
MSLRNEREKEKTNEIGEDFPIHKMVIILY